MSFAIFTFRASGPIKSWSALKAAQAHNCRQIPLAHQVPDSPPFRILAGTRDIVARTRAMMITLGIDPDRIRKNGVIVYEAVMTASPIFFEKGDEAERGKRLDDWVAAQMAFALGYYGAHRVVSMILHLDEKTPHVHIIVLPVAIQSDRRRKDSSPRWVLAGRSISGPGKFDHLQDEYARAMEPLGLRRGERGRGQKNEPPGHFMNRLREEKAMTEERMKQAEQSVADWERRRRLLDEDEERVRRDRAIVNAEKAAVASREAQLAAERAAFEAEKAEWRLMIAMWKKRIKAAREALRAIAAERDWIKAVVRAIDAFHRVAVNAYEIFPPRGVREALDAAVSLRRSIQELEPPPEPDTGPDTPAFYRELQRRAEHGR